MRAALGPDGVPTSCYICGGETLIDFLVFTFQRSVLDGEVPLTMKKAIISPIFKGGDAAQASCYRPVALTTHISKILE